MLEVDPATLAVREHIEGVVEKLIIGNLDNAAVGKIFRDEICESPFGMIYSLIHDYLRIEFSSIDCNL
jgi:hypothetical protein